MLPFLKEFRVCVEFLKRGIRFENAKNVYSNTKRRLAVLEVVFSYAVLCLRALDELVVWPEECFSLKYSDNFATF